MPARSKRKTRRFLRKKNHKNFKLFWYSFLLVFLGVWLTILFFNRDFWRKNSKLSLAIQEEDASVIVATFDPTVGEITTIRIPPNTEVNAAFGLGVWKLRSVWELGENEHLGGRLLARTLVRHFKFPVVAWADARAAGFVEGKAVGFIQATLAPYATNLKMGDRLQIALFSLRIPNSKRQEIALEETSYLRKTVLTDGEEGYTVTGTMPSGLSAVFTNPDMSSKEMTVVIKDATKEGSYASDVGKLIEVLGAKVASVVKEKPQEECQVTGKDRAVVEEVARILGCTPSKEKLKSSLDIEIKLGEEFARSF